MAQQRFIDETKRNGLAMVAVSIPSTQVAQCRASLRSLLRPRQRRIHFKSERSSTRGAVLEMLERYDVAAYAISPSDPMLWAADALAWCYLNPKTHWRSRSESFFAGGLVRLKAL